MSRPRRRHLVVGLVLAWAGTSAPGHADAASLVLKEAPVLSVDANGEASATLTIVNEGTTPLQPVRLHLSDFAHKRADGKPYLLGTTRTLAPAADKDKAIFAGAAPLGPGAALDVRLTVTNVKQAGQSEARLKDGDADVPVRGGPTQAIVKAVRIPTTYNVQIVSATQDSPEIHFLGDRALVQIKNADASSYRFTWKLRVDGRLHDGGPSVIDLPPNDTRWVSLAPPEGSQTFPRARWLTAGTLKDDVVKGNLILEPIFDGDAVTQPLVAKDVPVRYRFSYWRDANLRQAVNAIAIFALLMVGGLISIAVHHGLPNSSRRLALKRRISELDEKVQGLGQDVESSGRVRLESHLGRIRRDLDAHVSFLPSFATNLDQCATRIDMVQQWVEVAYGVSVVLHRARESSELVPPTVLRAIHDNCAQALTPVESGFTTAEEVAAMKADVKAAQNALDISLAGQSNGDLEKAIRDREERLIPLRPQLTGRYPALTGLVAGLAEAPPPPPYRAVDYYDRDSVSLKIDLLRAFDGRVQQLTGVAGQPPVEPLTRLNERREALMKYLAADTHESLRVALLLVNEMRQDIYAEGLAKALQQHDPPAARITTHPARLSPGTPIMLTLRFDRDILNEAVARQEWRCIWNFGDGSPRETGWVVFHTYEDAGNFTAEVSIIDLDAKPVIPSRPMVEALTIGDGAVRAARKKAKPAWYQRVRMRHFGRFLPRAAETRIELVRTAIVLGLAMIGLMATARDQVDTLTFVGAVAALVALGFGVDTIKNLALQQRPAGS